MPAHYELKTERGLVEVGAIELTLAFNLTTNQRRRTVLRVAWRRKGDRPWRHVTIEGEPPELLEAAVKALVEGRSVAYI